MIEKSQAIRLIDVFFLGPFMIYASTKISDQLIKNVLKLIGILTITYNGRNYLLNQGK